MLRYLQRYFASRSRRRVRRRHSGQVAACIGTGESELENRLLLSAGSQSAPDAAVESSAAGHEGGPSSGTEHDVAADTSANNIESGNGAGVITVRTADSVFSADGIHALSGGSARGKSLTLRDVTDSLQADRTIRLEDSDTRNSGDVLLIGGGHKSFPDDGLQGSIPGISKSLIAPILKSQSAPAAVRSQTRQAPGRADEGVETTVFPKNRTTAVVHLRSTGRLLIAGGNPDRSASAWTVAATRSDSLAAPHPRRVARLIAELANSDFHRGARNGRLEELTFADLAHGILSDRAVRRALEVDASAVSDDASSSSTDVPPLLSQFALMSDSTLAMFISDDWLGHLQDGEEEESGSASRDEVTPDAAVDAETENAEHDDGERRRRALARLERRVESHFSYALLSQEPPEQPELTGILQRLACAHNPRGPPVSDVISASGESRAHADSGQLRQLRYVIAPRGPSVASAF